MKVEMISWIAFVMGVFLFVVGVVIWAGKKIDMVHGDDASKVARQDIAPYAKILGIGIMVLALAVMAYGVLSCFHSVAVYWQYVVVGVLGAIGVIILIIGHKKYFPD